MVSSLANIACSFGRVWLAADHPKVVVDLVPSTYKPISAGVPAKEIGNWTQGVLPADGRRRFAGGRRMILLEVRAESLKKDLETQRALCADAPEAATTCADPGGRHTARNTMLGSGMPRWLVGASVEYAEAYSQGWGDFVTTDFQAITGREPRAFMKFAADSAPAFGGALAPARHGA